MAKLSKVLELTAYFPNDERTWSGKDVAFAGENPASGASLFSIIAKDADGNQIPQVFETYRGIPFSIREDQSGAIEVPTSGIIKPV